MGKRIVRDVVIWLLGAILCVLLRLITEKEKIVDYIPLFLAMMVIWILLGLLFFKYWRSYKETWYWQAMLSMLLTGGAEMLLVGFLLPLLPWSFSVKTALWMIGAVMVVDAAAILWMHYWKFALNMTVPVMQVEQRENARAKRPDELRSDESIETIRQSVLSLTTEEDYRMLVGKANLNLRSTKIVANRDRFSFLQIPDYQYKTLVDLTLLNDFRGINKRLCIVNQKLPDDGIYVCCYRPQEYVKEKMLHRYPTPLNWVIYLFWFLVRRVIPRLLLMSRLYYELNRGRKRMLSKTEVLGRLYYCGFEVLEVVPMGHIEYVFARRHSQPYPQEQIKVYGPLIKLPRISKNKEIVYFYKFRTMHPYAEYIQTYVFDQRGGMDIADKSNDDWRITSWGRWMRKYWLDELPMIFNFLKGDIKLVGIRPLSRAMFSTYPKELQDKRTRTKPGLIPPFYVDHPKTFDELCASENKYLDEYFEHPLWTDVKYFFMTAYSILFKKMHSA